MYGILAFLVDRGVDGMLFLLPMLVEVSHGLVLRDHPRMVSSGERAVHRTRRRIGQCLCRTGHRMIPGTWKRWNRATHETASHHALHAGGPGAPGCLSTA